MRLLLDTHTFLWFVGGDGRLSAAARALILDPSNERFLSVASLWEMAIKAGLGRLHLSLPFSELVERQVHGNAIGVLPILPPHLDMLVTLPFHHKDPFDRLLAAQALAEGIPLVTRDAALTTYGVKALWETVP